MTSTTIEFRFYPATSAEVQAVSDSLATAVPAHDHTELNVDHYDGSGSLPAQIFTVVTSFLQGHAAWAAFALVLAQYLRLHKNRPVTITAKGYSTTVSHPDDLQQVSEFLQSLPASESTETQDIQPATKTSTS